MDGVIDDAMIDRLAKLARELPCPIQPCQADDGRDFYFVVSPRWAQIQRLAYMSPGWTWKAVAFRGEILYEAVQIETMRGRSGATTLFMEPRYIDP